MIVSCIRDFERAAQARLPPFLFDYIAGGAGDELTMSANLADLQAVRLRQRVLTNVSDVSTRSTLFGVEQALPVVLGPVGLAGMYARRGECQAARAAAAAAVPFCLSTMSLCAIEEVAAACTAPFWFQLYIMKDRSFLRDLMARARAAGSTTLVFTVDMPLPGKRHRDAHSALSGPNASLRRLIQAFTHPSWAIDVGLLGRPHKLGNIAPVLGEKSGLEDFMGWISTNFDPAITWADLDWLRAEWTGSLVLKGILDAEDARAAVDIGADAIVVSNHGGRQLDGAISTTRALPALVDAIGGRAVVLADGGIRSGVDVVRMLALGADAVLLGRAWAYALAAAGEEGVTRMLQMISAEMRVTMSLIGATRLESIGAALIDTR